MEKKKVFISLPMNGKTDDEIINTINHTKDIITELYKYQYELEFIDTFITEDADPNVNAGIWYLGRSLELLSHADIAYFCPGWDKAKGCVIENKVAVEYGIERILLS